MKKLLLVMLVLAVSAGYAGTPMTNSGDKALTFVMNGLGNFGVSGPSVITSGGFGGKYFLSQDMAVRGIIEFSNSTTSTPGTGGDDEVTATTIGIAPGLEWHMNAAGAVSPYFGVMGQFGMVKNTNSPAGGTETSSSGTAFGLAGFLGAEWFAWDGVSFNAEYQLGFTSVSSEFDNGTTTVDGPSITNIGIDSWAVGINIYLGQ